MLMGDTAQQFSISFLGQYASALYESQAATQLFCMDPVPCSQGYTMKLKEEINRLCSELKKADASCTLGLKGFHGLLSIAASIM